MSPLSSSTHNMDSREFDMDNFAGEREVSRARLLLTVKEASEILSISRSKLYELLNSGSLPSVHIGRSRRLRLTDIQKFVLEGVQEF